MSTVAFVTEGNTTLYNTSFMTPVYLKSEPLTFSFNMLVDENLVSLFNEYSGGTKVSDVLGLLRYYLYLVLPNSFTKENNFTSALEKIADWFDEQYKTAKGYLGKENFLLSLAGGSIKKIRKMGEGKWLSAPLINDDNRGGVDIIVEVNGMFLFKDVYITDIDFKIPYVSRDGNNNLTHFTMSVTLSCGTIYISNDVIKESSYSIGNYIRFGKKYKSVPIISNKYMPHKDFSGYGSRG
jgi:hypothetical protein